MVQWLTTLKNAKDIAHLSRHYVLLVENNFFVFTSKPINGLKSHVISETNIEQKPQQQILIENPIKVDSTRMCFRTTDKCLAYHKNNSSQLKPFVDKLTFFEKKVNPILEQEN